MENGFFSQELLRQGTSILIKMDDQTKTISKILYDALLSYLIQSSTALGDTARAIAPDPLHAARIVVLNDSLASARVLLSKVIHPYSNPFFIRFPLLFIAVT
jgi:hypothetical protein